MYNGDTIGSQPTSGIFYFPRFNSKTAAAKYNRLRNAVYVTYPYARKAGMVMNEMNDRLIKIHDSEEKRKYIRSKESALRKEFTDPPTNLSIYQGKSADEADQPGNRQ